MLGLLAAGLTMGAGSVALPPRVANYNIQARLDTSEHRVEGRLELAWTHTGTVPVGSLPLHLYMNAFRSPDTAWMRQAEGHHRGASQGDVQPWGGCALQLVQQRDADGSWTTVTARERDDPSLADVALAYPVRPGETLVLAIEFTTTLPQVFARTGYRRDFYMVGQWFPKVARLEGDTWTDFVFHHHGEFYADFGDYHVDLDVPSTMVVAATGQRIRSEIREDRQSLGYEAEAVHDFAWTAWPSFQETRRTVEGVEVLLLYPPEASAEARTTQWEAIEASLQSLQRRFGPYPWPVLTVVEPPGFAAGAHGMEYPTLVTTEPAVGLPRLLAPLGIAHRMHGAMTTAHEIGHQYFQGMLASNEDAEPWLDEGINTFANILILEDHAPEDPWLVRVAGHSLHPDHLLRLALRDRALGPPSSAPAGAFDPATRSYGAAVYLTPAALLMTLRRMVGKEAFDRAFEAYAVQHRFRHPTTADFEQSLTAAWDGTRTLGPAIVAGQPPVELDGSAVLRQGLHDTARVGFAVRRVTNLRRNDAPPLGLVVLERTGDFILPVEVEVEFDDGTHARGYWDGRSRSQVLRFPGQRVRRASLDPGGRLVLEADRHDNHRYAPNVALPRGPASALGAMSEALALVLMAAGGP